MNNFTTHQSFFLVPLQGYVEEWKKIDYFLHVLEKSGIDEIIRNSYSKVKDKGRSGYNPYHLFSAVSYCFAVGLGALREIEDRCKYDIRLMYLMDNKAPSYKTIDEFINEVILPNQFEIFTRITAAIIDQFDLDISDQYLDGTKLEANANKYKFVWKPVKYHKNLDKKIREHLKNIDVTFDSKELIKSHQLLEILNKYAQENGFKPEAIPFGKGRRMTPEQKNYKTGYKYLIKLLEYEEKEAICGENRKSYYKTDHDATAMALKTDYYSGHGTNMHAAYNVQALVSSGIITFYGVYQDRTDYYTLKPMLEKYHDYYGTYPKNLCADSGYGIYENYKYLGSEHIGNYVKFLSWNGESTAKHPQLYYLNDNGDGFTCLGGNAGERIPFDSSHHQRKKGGVLYMFSGCNSCGYAYKCKEKMKDKTQDHRYAELIPEYEELKQEARINLLSRKGIEIRINRSIQVEGTFGQVKQNMRYVRIRRRGLEKVSCEIMLVCLGRNIRKIFSMVQSGETKDKYWEAPEDLQPERFKKPKPKQ